MMTAAVCHPLLSPARVLRAMVACACCFWLAGCAGPAGLFGSDARAAPFRDPGMSMQSAKDLVVIGEATRADVMAALGPATVVKFDSGFEVWVYRAKSPESNVGPAEFVLLFAPSGIVKKARLRPEYVRQDG